MRKKVLFKMLSAIVTSDTKINKPRDTMKNLLNFKMRCRVDDEPMPRQDLYCETGFGR